MMLVGIGCCAGRIVTAFGIRDSMITIGEIQYSAIQTYELEASFDVGEWEDVEEGLSDIAGIDGHTAAYHTHVELEAEETLTSVNLLCFSDAEAAEGYRDFHSSDSALSLPDTGEALISPKVAEKLDLSEAIR